MPLLATMFTITTYGTWLRGDRRGWVDDGTIFPANPTLEAADRARMRHAPFVLAPDELLRVGALVGESLQSRLKQRLLAMAVQTWHLHCVVAASDEQPPMIVKCAKDAVRWGLRPNRPIWTDGYDKRYCFDERSVASRIDYVERHNLAVGLPRRPWPFIVSYP
jgi:hypothetical protein